MLQNEALDILKLGHNVYLTGAAGSGKTYVLNAYIDYLRENMIQAGVTASTGIAATHMNGMTIHSWAGIGILDEIGKDDMERILRKPQLKKRMNDAKVLIIDEVSMLHGNRLDLIDQVCRAFKDNTKPFGGLQVVLCGDLFQLPPITRGRSEPDFIFHSNAWKNMNLKVCYLTEQYRQDDQRLLDVLSAIRANEIDDAHFEHIQSRFDTHPGERHVTRLYTHNASVDEINTDELTKLEGEVKTYQMLSSGNKKIAESLTNTCLAPEELNLKIGAKVMFVANNFAEHFVNGSLGEVIGFNESGYPVVQTNDRIIDVKPHTWQMKDGEKVLAEVSQLPLRLAWAITIHKSQGMSLDAAEMDLSKSFEPGMGYVALSRVRSLDGLYIKGINNTALMVHPVISELDVLLRQKSNKLQKQLATIKSADKEGHHKRVRLALRSDEDKLLEGYDETLFERLKKWRREKAEEQSAPAYIILSDKSLKFIAALRPQTKKELSAIHGIGEQKLERYCDDLLQLTTS